MEDKYNKNFIKVALVRIDFLGAITALTSSIPKKIAMVLQKNFPNMAQKQATTFTIQIGNQGPKIDNSSSQNAMIEWTFSNQARDKKAVLTNQCLFFEYSTYDSYSSLETPVNEIWTVMQAALKDDLQVRRLGMRYINEINLDVSKDPSNWKGLLTKPLLNMLAVDEEKSELAKCTYDSYINYGNFMLHSVLGITNPDFPAPINRKIFILDYDAYSEGLISNSEICPLLKGFHEKIKGKFEKSIDAGLRRIMNA